ncbi:MAG: hypothetical protein ACI9TO_000270 [Rickettsiales bacterium]|jgi:hypothetical protein
MKGKNNTPENPSSSPSDLGLSRLFQTPPPVNQEEFDQNTLIKKVNSYIAASKKEDFSKEIKLQMLREIDLVIDALVDKDSDQTFCVKNQYGNNESLITKAVDAYGDNRKNTLFFAIESGDIELIQHLLDKGLSAKTPTLQDGDTFNRRGSSTMLDQYGVGEFPYDTAFEKATAHDASYEDQCRYSTIAKILVVSGADFERASIGSSNALAIISIHSSSNVERNKSNDDLSNLSKAILERMSDEGVLGTMQMIINANKTRKDFLFPIVAEHISSDFFLNLIRNISSEENKYLKLDKQNVAYELFNNMSDEKKSDIELKDQSLPKDAQDILKGMFPAKSERNTLANFPRSSKNSSEGSNLSFSRFSFSRKRDEDRKSSSTEQYTPVNQTAELVADHHTRGLSTIPSVSPSKSKQTISSRIYRALTAVPLFCGGRKNSGAERIG